MKRVLLGSLLLLVVALQAANGMYLTMREGQAKCFIEEIPKDTLLVSNWKCEDAPRTAYNNNGQPQETLSQKSFGMTVTIKDPMDQIVYTHNHMRDDKLAFTSATGGEHTICFVTSSSTWFHAFEFSFHVTINTGSAGVDYDAIAKREHLDAVAIEIRRLNDRLATLRASQSYHKGREATMRDTSESTYERVFYWSLLQIVIVMLSAFVQTRYLKRFFMQKKQH